jgi:hypothetical protein
MDVTMDDKNNLFGLYSVENEPSTNSILNSPKGEESLFEELSRFVTGTEREKKRDALFSSPLDASLEERIEAFWKGTKDGLSRYLHRPHRGVEKGHHLLFLEGWSEGRRAHLPHQGPFASSGGFFFSWEGTGIVINPGREFLERFHSNGYSICDIDHVIVTENDEELFRDLLSIYQLNLKANRTTENPHFIRYTLERRVHERMAPSLKPVYKHERDMVRPFDLFVDSTNGESVELSPHVHLRYVPSKGQGEGGLHLFFDLFQKVGDPLSMCYLSRAPYSEKLKEMARGVDLLIAGFGHTGPYDLGKVEYSSDSLGFYGTLSLIDAIEPKLLVMTDFSGTEGDIRLEVAKKMRSELLQLGKGKTTVLPASSGLELNLVTLEVTCGLTGAALHRDEVKMLKAKEPFAPLTYLSDAFLL